MKYRLFTALYFFSTVFNLQGQDRVDKNRLDGLVKHGQLVVPYNSIEEALTLDPLRSSRVISLEWQKDEKKAMSAGDSALQFFTSRTKLPADWAEDEKYLYIYSPKTAFMLEINGVKAKLSRAGVNTSVRLTPLLREGSDSIIINLFTGKEHHGGISEVAHAFLLLSRPALPALDVYVKVHSKYRGMYRPLTWGIGTPVVNLTGKVVEKKYIWHEHYTSIYEQKRLVHADSSGSSHGSTGPGGIYHWSLYHPQGIYDYYWTAESPNLATTAHLQGSSRYNAREAISERIGVRIVEVKEGELRVNNVALTLKPVAYRHPALSEHAPSREMLLEYVLNLKRHNVNAVIVSGLPVNADLYELADEYGLYIVQEISLPADSGVEADLWMLQQLSMVYLLRNRPSVVAWQLGEAKSALDKAMSQAFRDSIGTREKHSKPNIDPQRPVLSDRLSNMPVSVVDFGTLTVDGLKRLKQNYQPVDLWVADDTKQNITIRNGLNFEDLKGITLHWKITDGDKVVNQGEVKGIKLAKGKIQSLELPFKFRHYEKSNYRFHFSVRLGIELPWAEKGYELAWGQFKFNGTNGNLGKLVEGGES